jgi:NTP pyrophosphatase (non-canonical NTP hydrolase)
VSDASDLQTVVAGAVAARGYRAGWTDEQFAARQVCKAVEELGELAEAIEWTADGRPAWARSLKDSAHLARVSFDGRFGYIRAGDTVAAVDRELVASELADVAIPLFALADALGIDLAQAVRDKVAADVARGVRRDTAE